MSATQSEEIRPVTIATLLPGQRVHHARISSGVARRSWKGFHSARRVCLPGERQTAPFAQEQPLLMGVWIGPAAFPWTAKARREPRGGAVAGGSGGTRAGAARPP